MSNRTKSLERNVTHLKVDPLQSLFDSCRRNGRPAKFPTKETPIPSDTEMFRWWFCEGQFDQDSLDAVAKGNFENWTLQQYRDCIRNRMKEYYNAAG